jgi:sugar phosphate isomerase/epimerase
MKLSVLTVLLGNLSLDAALKYLSALGVEAVEIGCGGYPGAAHANANELLKNNDKLQDFKDTIKRYNMTISALSVHGNPVHPNKAIANAFHEQYEAAVLLAEKLGLERVVTFSGCPGDQENAKYPNWVTCAWPEDYQEILKWQWEEVLIPYWKKASTFALDHGVNKICLEMHPGFCVYNPETLLKLRQNVGNTIGANFDPSHLFWQGIDPVAAIMELKDAIYHFHAKDTKINPYTTSRNGVLDTKHFSKEAERSWLFRTVGYGHNEEVWKDMISALRLVGYDHVLSIEHEDSLMTADEGLKKAVTFLKSIMIHDTKPTDMWWA